MRGQPEWFFFGGFFAWHMVRRHHMDRAVLQPLPHRSDIVRTSKGWIGLAQGTQGGLLCVGQVVGAGLYKHPVVARSPFPHLIECEPCADMGDVDLSAQVLRKVHGPNTTLGFGERWLGARPVFEGG